MSEWQEIIVNEIKATSKNAAVTGPFGSSISAKFFMDSGVPVIRGSNLSEDIDKRLIDEDLVFISPEKALEFSRSIARKGDLIFTCWGTIAQVGIIDDRSKFKEYVISNKQMKLTPAPDKADGLFLYYLFSSPQVRRQILQNAIGSSVPGFNLGQLKSIKLKLPPLEEQKRITSLLDGLDRKIENLRRQNETLEAIAQTLFKHWFVDFEFPNEDGKPYKSSGGEMVRSELGEIPADWRVVRIEEIADRIAMGPFGSRITTDNFVDSGVPVIRGGNLVNGFNGGDFVYLTEEKADELKSSNAFSEDIVFTHRGTLGQVGFIPTHSQYSRYVVSQSQMLLGVNKNLASPRFVYRFFCSQVGMNAILANTNTTGVPSIGRPTTTLKAIQIALPEENVMRQFDSLVKATDFKKEANDKQIQTLTKTRDVLLPKLMSGKLRITE